MPCGVAKFKWAAGRKGSSGCAAAEKWTMTGSGEAMRRILIVVVVCACTRDDRFRIMPLGDSITAEVNAYRAPLYRGLVGYEVDFVGGESNHGESIPDNDHEGHPGFTLSDLESHVAGYISATPSDLILLYGGINDVATGISGADAAARLDQLLGTIYRTDPDTAVIVAAIAPVKSGGVYDSPSHTDNLVRLNEAIPSVVSAWANEGKHVSWTDCDSGYGATWYSDDIHPDAAGYDFIAARFLAAIEAIRDDLGLLPAR